MKTPFKMTIYTPPMAISINCNLTVAGNFASETKVAMWLKNLTAPYHRGRLYTNGCQPQHRVKIDQERKSTFDLSSWTI